MLNLATILEASARRHSEREAIVHGAVRLTYAELDGAAKRIAQGLVSKGVRPGDRVALSCPNLPYFPMVYFAILQAGAVVVPLNVLLKRREVAYHLADSQARAYFCFQGTDELPMGEEGYAGFEATASCDLFVAMNADAAAAEPFAGSESLSTWLTGSAEEFEMVPTLPDDTAVILYTSGTTGQPKGAELSHVNVMMNCFVTRDMMRYQDGDVGLIVLPLFHSFGQVVQMNSAVLAGATSVLLPRFDAAEVLRLMLAEQITIFCGVPTMYWGLLALEGAEEKFDLAAIAANLRLCASGGASLPLQVLRDFEEKFDVPILEGYGLSETSPVASFNQLEQERKPGSVGTPVWGVEMRLVDDQDQPVPVGERGEIVIRGHNVMKGYFRRPEANEEVMRGGWFHTGDVGTMDEDGYFYIVDRTKDMIIRGGFNVYPREIEELLVQHPAVSMAAVIGVPHNSLGEEIKAYVVLTEGAELSAEETVAWAKERLAAYKYPRQVEIRAQLPMTATGKILKKELRENP